MVGVGHNLRLPGGKWLHTRAYCLGSHVFLWRWRQAVCNSAATGLWDMLWQQSKVCSRGTLVVAEEGLREGKMQQFFPKLNLQWMSNLSLSILLRKPGPGTSVINIQGWIFIHTFPSLPLFALHQTAIHVAKTGGLLCSHIACLEINSKLNKVLRNLIFSKAPYSNLYPSSNKDF